MGPIADHRLLNRSGFIELALASTIAPERDVQYRIGRVCDLEAFKPSHCRGTIPTQMTGEAKHEQFKMIGLTPCHHAS